MMFTLTVIFVACVMVPVLFFAFAAFDVLIRKLYREHRDQWEACGQPHGMMWHAPETSRTSFKSDMAMKKLQYAWLFRTPSWAAADPSATRWLKWLRFAVLFWNVALISLVIAWKVQS